MLFCNPILYDVTFHPEKNIIEFTVYLLHFLFQKNIL